MKSGLSKRAPQLDCCAVHVLQFRRSSREAPEIVPHHPLDHLSERPGLVFGQIVEEDFGSSHRLVACRFGFSREKSAAVMRYGGFCRRPSLGSLRRFERLFPIATGRERPFPVEGDVRCEARALLAFVHGELRDLTQNATQ
jgi:hypothetical protein